MGNLISKNYPLHLKCLLLIDGFKADSHLTDPPYGTQR